MRKLVYVASPLSGDVENNLNFARQACLYTMSQGATPFAPHLLYPQVLDDSDPAQRELGMRMGNQMLALCDELWLCGDTVSPGMAAEKKLAEELNITVRTVSTEEIVYRPPDGLCQEAGDGASIATAPPSLYAILAEGISTGPLAGQSGYLAEEGRRLYFHKKGAAEQKIRDLQNRCMNRSPAAVYKCVAYPCAGMPDRSITAEAIGSYDLRPGFDPAEAELRSQVYGNTGGGCMVGTASYYLPSLGRMVWVSCNDEGATITSADYVWNDDDSGSWERYEDVLLLHVNFYEMRPDDLGPWLPMVRDTLAYTASQQAAQGRSFRLPESWQDTLEEQGQPPGPAMEGPC